VTGSHAFCDTSPQPRVITSSFGWFTVLSVSFVIGEWLHFYNSQLNASKRPNEITTGCNWTDYSCLCYGIAAKPIITNIFHAMKISGSSNKVSSKTNIFSYEDFFLLVNSIKPIPIGHPSSSGKFTLHKISNVKCERKRLKDWKIPKQVSNQNKLSLLPSLNFYHSIGLGPVHTSILRRRYTWPIFIVNKRIGTLIYNLCRLVLQNTNRRQFFINSSVLLLTMNYN